MTRDEIYNEIYKPLMAKIMSVDKKLDEYIDMSHGQSTANIDYLSAMTGIDIPIEDKEGNNAQ